MKKVLLAIAMLLGMFGVSRADVIQVTAEKSPVVSDAACKYKLADARAGLKTFVQVGFAPRAQSQDGNRQLGLAFYHNPASKTADSVDALALVLLDKRMPDKELTFLVVYIGPQKSVVFKREVQKDGKTIGPCFEKTLEDNPKEKSN